MGGREWGQGTAVAEGVEEAGREILATDAAHPARDRVDRRHIAQTARFTLLARLVQTLFPHRRQLEVVAGAAPPKASAVV
eukprot:1977513-Rhodomonas_salina.1